MCWKRPPPRLITGEFSRPLDPGIELEVLLDSPAGEAAVQRFRFVLHL
jgi:hypothetical protein